MYNSTFIQKVFVRYRIESNRLRLYFQASFLVYQVLFPKDLVGPRKSDDPMINLQCEFYSIVYFASLQLTSLKFLVNHSSLELFRSFDDGEIDVARGVFRFVMQIERGEEAACRWKDASTGVDRMRCKLAFRGPGVTLETPGRGSVHRLLLPLF